MSTHGTPPSPRSSAQVRLFTTDDRDAVLALTRRLTLDVAPWLNPDAVLAAVEAWVRGTIDDLGPDSGVFVAEDAGVCRGFITVARNVHWSGAVQAYIGELVVAEDAEGTGMGQALLAVAEAWAREQGYSMIVLDTGAANTRARAFYMRAGFAEESVRLVKLLR